MFPNSFSARVAERIVVWGALIGFLVLLHGAVKIIYASQMTEILNDRRQATASLLSHVETQSPGTLVDATNSEFGKAIAKRIRAIDQRQAGLRDSNEQNELLIGLLTLFVIAMILFLEYRWLVKPVVRMAAVLRTQEEGRGAS